MLDNNVSAILLNIADQFSMAAKIFMGADEWFQRQSLQGYAGFITKEWKERYRYCGKVRKHVIDHRGVVSSIASAQAATSMYSAKSIVCSALEACIAADNNVLVSVDLATENLANQKKHSCVDFLCDLRNDFHKDVNEVYHEKELAGFSANHPPGILLLNKDLLKRYPQD